MAGQSYKRAAASPSTSGPEVGPPAASTDVDQEQLGNAAIQEQLASESPGRLTYRAALGEMLGDALYDQLEDQLTDGKLVEHAQGAVDGAMDTLRDYLAGQVDATQQDAANVFVQALQSELERIAESAVVDTGLSEGVRGFADANPLVIASAAVAGAVAYVLTNQDLPLIEQKLGLGGGHSLIAGVDPGRTMEMALEQVRVGYRYEGAGTSGSVTGDRYEDGWQVQGQFQRTLDQGETLTLDGLHVDRAGDERSRLDLNYANPSLAASAFFERRYGEGGFDAVGGSLSTVANSSDDLRAYMRGEVRTNGTWEGAAGIGRDEGKVG